MTFIYMPFDLFFKPVAEDHEIWFGFSLTGWWGESYRAVALGNIRSRSLWLLAYAQLDVALGIGIRGSGGHCDGGLEPD